MGLGEIKKSSRILKGKKLNANPFFLKTLGKHKEYHMHINSSKSSIPESIKEKLKERKGSDGHINLDSISKEEIDDMKKINKENRNKKEIKLEEIPKNEKVTNDNSKVLDNDNKNKAIDSKENLNYESSSNNSLYEVKKLLKPIIEEIKKTNIRLIKINSKVNQESLKDLLQDLEKRMTELEEKNNSISNIDSITMSEVDSLIINKINDFRDELDAKDSSILMNKVDSLVIKKINDFRYELDNKTNEKEVFIKNKLEAIDNNTYDISFLKNQIGLKHNSLNEISLLPKRVAHIEHFLKNMPVSNVSGHVKTMEDISIINKRLFNIENNNSIGIINKHLKLLTNKVHKLENIHSEGKLFEKFGQIDNRMNLIDSRGTLSSLIGSVKTINLRLDEIEKTAYVNKIEIGKFEKEIEDFSHEIKTISKTPTTVDRTLENSKKKEKTKELRDSENFKEELRDSENFKELENLEDSDEINDIKMETNKITTPHERIKKLEVLLEEKKNHILLMQEKLKERENALIKRKEKLRDKFNNLKKKDLFIEAELKKQDRETKKIEKKIESEEKEIESVISDEY